MRRLLGEEWGLALLPEYVFLEIVTVLSLRCDLQTAVRSGEALLQAREVEFVSCSEFFLDSWRIFRQQERGKLSFADAAILAIAEGRAAEAIATFDRTLSRAAGNRSVP